MKKQKLPTILPLRVPAFFYWISGLWILIVSLNYFNGQTHPIFTQIFSKLHLLFSVPLLLTAVFVGWLILKKAFKNYHIVFSVTPLYLFFSVSILAFIGLLYKGLEKNIITFGDIPSASLSLGLKLLLINIWLIILTAVTFSSGSWIVRFLKLPQLTKFSKPIISLALGYIVLNTGLFFLSLIGHLKGTELVILLGLFLLAGIPHLKSFFNLIRYQITIDTEKKSFVFWCGWLLFLTVVLNFSIQILPFPTGWDSLTFYFNLAKEAALSGSILRGQYAYPVELAYSMGYIIGNYIHLPEYADMLAVFVAGWGGILTTLTIVLLGRQLSGWKTGIVGGLLYSSMPLITFFNGWEPKSEATLGAFIALSLVAYLKWRRSGKHQWLMLTAVFCAFTLLIKLTSAMLLVSLGIVFLYDLVWGERKTQRIKALVQTSGAVLVCLIVLSPWMILHLWEHHWSYSDYRDVVLGTDPIVSQNIVTLRKQWQTQLGTDDSSTGYLEDYGRYVGEEEGWWGLEKYLPPSLAKVPFARYASLPWDMVMSSNRKNTNMLTNSLLLMILPLFLWLWLFHRKGYKQLELPKQTKVLVIFAIVYLLLWIKLGWGVAWYGLGMIISFTMLTTIAILAIWKYPKIRYVILLLIILNQGLNLALHMNHYGHTILTGFALGKITKAQTSQALLPRLREIGGVINEDPEIISGKKKVIRVSGYFPYFVNDSRHVLIDDMAFDYLYALDIAYGHDDQKIIEALKNANIKYIAADVSIFYNDMTSDKTLQNKVLRFMEFASQSLYLVDAYEQGGVGVLLLEVK